MLDIDALFSGFHIPCVYMYFGIEGMAASLVGFHTLDVDIDSRVSSLDIDAVLHRLGFITGFNAVVLGWCRASNFRFQMLSLVLWCWMLIYV